MEQPVTFDCDGLRLSGLLHRADAERAVLVTHPHPLYGGNMYNPVVETVVRTYRSKGFTTLRFNFRGTGGSQGAYSDGEKEPDDVAAAIAFLAQAGFNRIDLAGYSFGAWVCSRGADRYPGINRMMLVSPPVAFMNFEDVGALPALDTVITGSEDEFAPPAYIEKMMPLWNARARIQIINGADHFYFGFDRDLEQIISKSIK